MSTFSGKIKEFPQISIDRFDGRNLASTAYFLSHAHSDHMIGLSSPQFLDHLESNNGVYLYCSPITARFLQSSIRHRPLTPFICPLQPEETVKITVPNVAEEATHQLWVTLIPAAHCPGSVMFLFEGRGGTVLYTGDFRLTGEEATRITSLHNSDRSVKVIDSLHIDTTFCHREVMHFPSREESAQAVAELVEDWLARGNNFLIHLLCSAKYGYEYIYRSLYERFGMKIHVSRWKYRMYDTVPEIQEMLTLDATTTWIHACEWRSKNDNVDVETTTNRQLPCRCVPFGVDTEPNIRVIKPSAIFYAMYQSAKEIKQLNSNGTFCRVLLSMHASCSEVLDLVSYLRPRKVSPNVIPFNSTKEEVLKLLHEALNRSGDHYSIEYVGGQQNDVGSYRRRHLFKSQNISEGSTSSGTNSSSNLMDAGLLDVYVSSPNKKRRHSDSNMSVMIPIPRSNMKGSLSLEGDSRHHERTKIPFIPFIKNDDDQSCSRSDRPSVSTIRPDQPSVSNTLSDDPSVFSSMQTQHPTLSITDFDGESSQGWRDPYSPSPPKNLPRASFKTRARIVKEPPSTKASKDLYNSCESIAEEPPSTKASRALYDSCESIAEEPPSTKASRAFYDSYESIVEEPPSTNASRALYDCRESIVEEPPSTKTSSDLYDGRETIVKEPPLSKVSRDFYYSKRYDSRDSVFSEETDSVFDDSSRPESALGESATKQSRKMWYKHKYFSTPIHDEGDKVHKPPSKPLMCPRSSSLPLPNLFGSADLDLPLITVSSPSDQTSESQRSDDTNLTVVLSSGEPLECDVLLLEEALTDNNNCGPNNNKVARPSVICAPPRIDNGVEEKVRHFLKESPAPGKWMDCSTKSKLARSSMKRSHRMALMGGSLSSTDVVDLVGHGTDAPSSRSSCLKTTRRTQDQVEVVSFDHFPL